MAAISGTNVAAKIVPFTTDDKFATHVSTYGQGGWHEVATDADRDAIPTDRRIAGMAVYVTGTNKLYVLGANLTTWTEFESGSVDDVKVNGTSVVTDKIANVTVPTKVSDLDNDSGFISSVSWSQVTDKPTFATVATSGAYSDLSGTPSIIDNLTSTSTTDALSANQGRALQAEIESLQGLGRFLSTWNCATGLAGTNPPTSPYTYHTGDYFLVSVVSTATPAVNYKPNGSSYTTDQASTTVETAEVKVNDVYIYDGTNWNLQQNAQRDVSFSSIGGSPYDNTNLATALNGKQATITGAATTITTSDLTASRAVVSNASGKIAVSSVTSTELGYLSGVTSSIQTQINGKANTSDIPTVNNATLTIQKNGTDVATFTANSSTNTTANITVPTKVSDLSNDSGFITSASVSTLTDVTLTNLSNGDALLYDTSSSKWVNGKAGVSATYNATTKTITFA